MVRDSEHGRDDHERRPAARQGKHPPAPARAGARMAGSRHVRVRRKVRPVGLDRVQPGDDAVVIVGRLRRRRNVTVA